MTTLFKQLAVIVAAMTLGTSAAHAQDTGATGDGSWEDSTIWTYGFIPSSSNNVYIGSTYPSGAALTAVVTLSASESANNVYLGDGSSGASGTLNLGGNSLTIAGSLYIGQYGGAGTLNLGGGSFSAQSAYIDGGNSLSFGVNDAVSSLSVTNSSVVNTAAAGNVTGGAYVDYGSTLNLGANLNVNGNVDVRNGSSLNANGYSITSNQILLGLYFSSAVSLSNAGLVQPNDLVSLVSFCLRTTLTTSTRASRKLTDVLHPLILNESR